MGTDEEIQGYLNLSVEWLAGAEHLIERGFLAPGYHDAIHALELALKASLASLAVEIPKEHNVAGAFGLHFREAIDVADARRLNRILRSYNGPRYPDWAAPNAREMASDIELIQRIVREIAPSLIARRTSP